MIDALKRLVIGTPLEPISRRVLAAITPHNRNRQYDIQTLSVMQRVLNTESNCVDVGCHAGNMLREMLRHAPNGHHLAFEPLPDFFAQLQQTFELTNVKLFNAALSDTSGIATFQHVTSNPGYSGLRRRRYDRPDEKIREITVRKVRLDDVIDHPVHFMKIDVEGAELQVLLGATHALTKHRPFVVFEHGLGAFDAYDTDPSDVHSLFARCGLRVSLMCDWLANRPPLDLKAFRESVISGRDYYFIAHP
jgi:FkbM family methyltransferase